MKIDNKKQEFLNNFSPILEKIFELNCNYFLAKLYMPIINAYFDMNSILYGEQPFTNHLNKLALKQRAFGEFYYKDIELHFYAFPKAFHNVEFLQECEQEINGKLLEMSISSGAIMIIDCHLISQEDVEFIQKSLHQMFTPFLVQIQKLENIAQSLVQQKNNSLYNDYFYASEKLFHLLMTNINQVYWSWEAVQKNFLPYEINAFIELIQAGYPALDIMHLKYKLEYESTLNEIQVLQYPDDNNYTGENLIADFWKHWKQYALLEKNMKKAS